MKSAMLFAALRVVFFAVSSLLQAQGKNGNIKSITIEVGKSNTFDANIRGNVVTNDSKRTFFHVNGGKNNALKVRCGSRRSTVTAQSVESAATQQC